MRNFHVCHVSINVFNRIYEDLILTIKESIIDLDYTCTVGVNELRGGAVNIFVGSTIFAARYNVLTEKVGTNPFIVYQLEPLDESAGLASQWPEYLDLLEKASWIFEYSPKNISYHIKRGWVNKVSIIEPGFHNSLERFRPLRDKTIDVLFYGSPHPRREKVINKLLEVGLKVNYQNYVVGDDLDRLIKRSKIILNIHAWEELSHLETVRISYLLSNRCLIVSEKSSHNPYGDGVIFCEYHDIVNCCVQLIQANENFRDEIANQGYLAIRANDFAEKLGNTLKILESKFGNQLEISTSGNFLDIPKARAEFAEAKFNLLNGDMPKGWDQYEARLQVPGLITPERYFKEPRWNGETFVGKTLLVHYEQGFGDTLMLVRFLPQVKAQGGRVLLLIQPQVAYLLTTCQGVDQIILQGKPLPTFDLQVSLFSLPAVFQTDQKSLPAGIPYLGIPQQVPNRESIAEILVASAGQFRIALAWAGDPDQPRYADCPFPVSLFNRLEILPGVAWYGFQPGCPVEPTLTDYVSLAPLLGTFSAQAYALSGMDLLITVDTTLAHLAGALGIPTLLLVSYEPNFRWMLERDDSPWYPAMRIFRQPRPRDWDAVLTAIVLALTEGM